MPKAPRTKMHRKDPDTEVPQSLTLKAEDAFDALCPTVLAAFGTGPMHRFDRNGHWDLERAAAENPQQIVRSARRFINKTQTLRWEDLTLQLGERQFLNVDERRMVCFAPSPEEARQLVEKFSQAYLKPCPTVETGSFFLIRTGRGGISTEQVDLDQITFLSTEALELHYGAEVLHWHHGFLDKLRGTKGGLTIFEGSPGTGKTYFLRHLMDALKESHRFYFIPTSSIGVLSSPDFVGFWAYERRLFQQHKFVVVLEDSDAALMTRGTDNREKVSAILNLSDGMLGDFLRLQIICTINCSAADIDQALLRPGRLICHRVFKRLDFANAARLAQSLGKVLTAERDYSIAEIYSDQDASHPHRRVIGFSAQE